MPRVVLIFVRIGIRAVLWVADLPEIFDELLALIVGVQRQESLAFFIRDDVDHVLVQPAFVLFGELGFLGVRHKRAGSKKARG